MAYYHSTKEALEKRDTERMSRAPGVRTVTGAHWGPSGERDRKGGALCRAAGRQQRRQDNRKGGEAGRARKAPSGVPPLRRDREVPRRPSP